MGSSKTTQETKIPEYLEEAGRLAVQQAQQAQQMGFIPYMGPEIAAVNPYEQALAQNVGGMASAFGLAAPSGLSMNMPTVTQGGMTGYSSYPIYQGAMERLREQRPDQYEYFAGQTGFDPITGAATGYTAPAAVQDLSTMTGGVAPASSGGSDDGPNMRQFMDERKAESARRANADPRASSPRPVLRGESTGGLFSGIRETKNRALDALGFI
jgi:hypothetical protein